MNTQANQEKRTIKVKDFLDDFRSGMIDSEILEKYHLTQGGLDKFYSMLIERGILEHQELEDHYSRDGSMETAAKCDSEKSSYICPCCLISQETMFDICPNCGVSFQELLERENLEKSQCDLLLSSNVNIENKVEPKPAQDSVEFPMADFLDKNYHKASVDESDLLGAAHINNVSAGFVDSADEVVSGLPLDCADETEKTISIQCANCQEEMSPALKDTYDHTRGRLGLIISGVCFLVAFMGSVAINYMDGFSLFRLAIVFTVGLSLLFGAGLFAVGSFIYLARERVFFCSTCGRVYPRG